MKIYTRTGDQGQTGLFGGPRVAKDHRRVDAYGDIDEANCCVGFAAALCADPELTAMLAAVQFELFDVGAVLATPPAREQSLQRRLALPVDEARIRDMEAAIDRLDAELAPLTTFVMPSGSPAAAALQLARATVRRAERAMVGLNRHEPLPPILLVYVNRLSDLLFTMARVANHRCGVPEPLWQPRRPGGATAG